MNFWIDSQLTQIRLWTFLSWNHRYLITLFFESVATAIECYQCSGSDPNRPFQCNEWLSDDIDLKPESSENVYDAKYCIKHVRRFGGVEKKQWLCDWQNKLTITSSTNIPHKSFILK